jgi:Domain of unknown function (DUF6457)
MQEWIDAVCAELGIAAQVDVTAILDVARDAAHNVERPAAPVSTYLLGYAAARGIDVQDAARRIGTLATEWSTSP